MGTLIDRFEEHEGPVRFVNFHPTQPIFVSGGDDYTIKVWSLQSRKCLFTLTGHLDYVRTVFFHHDLPWIISASDDQTIRIWNWQNRQEIACLTGHNHYVMCAQFHPTDDLIVSASMDQTVRVWDISGLRKKHSAPQGGMMSFENQLARQNVPQQDIFGNTDAVVKYVLEGHDKGVNWAEFHPRLPLIVSGGEDRLIKLWRMSDSKAWEVDTCRGHTSIVLTAIFHPRQDLILSVGEDKTIRTWDMNKRTPVKQFKRENDRFWLLASHPNMNLFAACHDSGVMVFKLDRERPAHTVFQNKMLFINNQKQVQMFDFETERETLPILSLKKVGKPWTKIRALSYNPSERSILLTTGDTNENSTYCLTPLPKDATGAIEPSSDLLQGDANFATFIARNRFVTYSKATQTLDVRDLNNSVTKSIKLESSVKDVVSAAPGTVLLLKSNSVVHYDVQQKKELAEIQVNNVKYVSWSLDGQHVALLSKHSITIATRKLELVTSLHETIRIKSATWDDTGVLIYSTLNHIKYTLLNGDNGIIKTLKNTLYVTRVHGKNCYCLNREGEVEILRIDPIEYRFKRALVNKNFGEVLKIIKNSNLVGQNIIAYLQKKGYPEIALQFVEDSETRFDLAIECGNLQVALEEARKLSTPATWERLGKEGIKQGNIEIVEFVYQQQRAFDKLSFLYLITGNTEKLTKMEHIAESRGDLSSLVQNTLYLNDVEKRINVFLEAGMVPLAYMLAKTSNLEELAEQILVESSVSATDVRLPLLGDVPSLPEVQKITGNWPLKPASLSFFEQALAGQVENLNLEDTQVEKDENLFEDDNDDALFEDAEALEEDGWDLDDEDLDVGDEDLETDDLEATPEVIVGGSVEIAHWIRNSRTAAGYVAAGEFDAAAQLLSKQLGVVDFEPLRSRFFEVYEASKLFLPTFAGLDPLKIYIRADSEEDQDSKIAPFIPGYDSLQESLQEGFKQFRANKLEDAIKIFRDIIYTIVVLTVSSKDEEEQCKEVLTICREYILGLSIELARRALPADDIERNLELAAYFTKVNLQRPHRVNALHVAMSQSFKHKNFRSAAFFATEFLKIVTSGPKLEQAQKIKTKSESISTDSVAIDFDPYAEFDICAATYTPIYKNAPYVTEALTGAKYQLSEKGSICKITKITSIGAPVSGLRILQ